MTHFHSSVFADAQRRLGLTKAGSARPLRVLVVDDEEAIRAFVTRVLEQAGCTVVTAADGVQALATASTAKDIDLLLTDLMMPNMNGDELARRLRASEPDLPVLYLTGFSDRLFAERMTLWENEAFLEKPCSIQALTEAVSLLTSGHIDRVNAGMSGLETGGRLS
jgi:two-component system, cell cycle sensor histidine kinase and response regulator CckA